MVEYEEKLYAVGRSEKVRYLRRRKTFWMQFLQTVWLIAQWDYCFQRLQKWRCNKQLSYVCRSRLQPRTYSNACSAIAWQFQISHLTGFYSIYNGRTVDWWRIRDQPTFYRKEVSDLALTAVICVTERKVIAIRSWCSREVPRWMLEVIFKAHKWIRRSSNSSRSLAERKYIMSIVS